MKSELGIYIHIPFCISKCAYCDFYSLGYSEESAERYTNRILKELDRWGAKLRRPADTLYFGGGTPSLLEAEQISAIIKKCKSDFLLNNAEITVEVNPAENLKDWLKEVKKAGVNRVSLGLQSAVDSELSLLSRRHNSAAVLRTVEDIKAAGIDNFSLDIMLGIPNQTKQSLKYTMDFALDLNPDHISTYLLSLEEGTPLYKKQKEYNIPSPDTAAELYLYACEYLEGKGLQRYEISNFAKNNKRSRHNTKYWLLADYLGLGPGSHSAVNGKRFYYSRNLEEYITSPKEINDGNSGGLEEEVMLALRLKEGISFNALKKRYPSASFEKAIKKADLFVKGGLLTYINGHYSLTHRGALVSNSVISQILSEL